MGQTASPVRPPTSLPAIDAKSRTSGATFHFRFIVKSPGVIDSVATHVRRADCMCMPFTRLMTSVFDIYYCASSLVNQDYKHVFLAARVGHGRRTGFVHCIARTDPPHSISRCAVRCLSAHAELQRDVGSAPGIPFGEGTSRQASFRPALGWPGALPFVIFLDLAVSDQMVNL